MADSLITRLVGDALSSEELPMRLERFRNLRATVQQTALSLFGESTFNELSPDANVATAARAMYQQMMARGQRAVEAALQAQAQTGEPRAPQAAAPSFAAIPAFWQPRSSRSCCKRALTSHKGKTCSA